MFLKGFKEKSNQKFIVKNVDLRRVDVIAQPISKVAIVGQESEINEIQGLKRFLTTLGLPQLNVSSLLLIDPKSEMEIKDKSVFTEKDLGWSGVIKSEQANAFVGRNYDLLICYNNTNVMPLDVISSKVNANLKVGMSEDEFNIFDVLINVNTQNLTTFTQELKKYLTVLNKL